MDILKTVNDSSGLDKAFDTVSVQLRWQIVEFGSDCDREMEILKATKVVLNSYKLRGTLSALAHLPDFRLWRVNCLVALTPVKVRIFDIQSALKAERAVLSARCLSCQSKDIGEQGGG